jgi:hypothetical protein
MHSECAPEDAENDKIRKYSPSGRYVVFSLLFCEKETSEKENKNNNDCTQNALLCHFYDPRFRYNIEKLLEVASEALKNQFNFIVIFGPSLVDVTFRG